MLSHTRIKKFENVHLDKILESSEFKELSPGPMHISAFEITGCDPTYKYILPKLKCFKDDVNILHSDLLDKNIYFDFTDYFIISRKASDDLSSKLKNSKVASKGSYGLDYFLYLNFLDENGYAMQGEDFEIVIRDTLYEVLDKRSNKSILAKNVHVSDLLKNGNVVYKLKKNVNNKKEFNGEIDLLVISEYNVEIPTMKELYINRSGPKKIMGDKLFFENVLNSE